MLKTSAVAKRLDLNEGTVIRRANALGLPKHISSRNARVFTEDEIEKISLCVIRTASKEPTKPVVAPDGYLSSRDAANLIGLTTAASFVRRARALGIEAMDKKFYTSEQVEFVRRNYVSYVDKRRQKNYTVTEAVEVIPKRPRASVPNDPLDNSRLAEMGRLGKWTYNPPAHPIKPYDPTKR